MEFSERTGLVDDQQITFEWMVVATLESAAFGIDLKQPVDGFRLEAGRERQSSGH
jgi:hypothetical protein